jgi:putative ABC transport system permease protein
VGAGRLISRRDVEGAGKVVFLGAKVADRLFGAAPAVGRAVQIEAIPFDVIGVAARKGDQMVNLGAADDDLALIPITTAQRWFTRGNEVTQVVYAPRTREESYESVPSVRGLTGLHHRFGEEDRNALGIFNFQEGVEMLHTMLFGQRLFLRVTSLITLLVGAMGVMNIMLVVVTERTKEIGLRKAVGASHRAIFGQFLAESVAVTILAGAVGAALALGGVAAVAHGMEVSGAEGPIPLIVPSSVLAIFATLVGTGVGAGMLPALRASRVEPAISLRAT